MTNCEKCGEHPVDCRCNANDKWYSFEELPPEEGQLCWVKMVTTVQMYYLPNQKDARWITPKHDQLVRQVATAWKPVPNAKKYKINTEPRAELD